MKKYVIGIDLGGTKIATAISDLKGEIVEKIVLDTKSYLGEEVVISRIIKTIDDVIEKSNINLSDIKAIGIGSPGPLDVKKGIIIETPNLPFKNFDIVSPISEKFKVKTYLDNDANVAAIGEFIFGAGVGKENLIYITVSTGIGAGAILNGKPYRGSTSNALEMGHIIVEPSSKHMCNCGKYGDVEALSSGTAIAKRAKEAIDKGEETSLKNLDKVTSKEVYEAYLKGDETSIRILDEAFKYLGIAIGNIITLFDPEIIVIGGGVSKIGEFFFEEIRKNAKKTTFDFMFDNTKIVPSKLGEDNNLIGAIALALIESKEYEKEFQ
ncbi:MAG: ROK family protein [Clostridium sp.]|nr:ROK family protein [Clostridium sp.]